MCINIETVGIDLDIPRDGLGMVAMQPFFPFAGLEPPCWQGDKKNLQLERIKHVLNVACQNSHGCPETTFTVFPENSIPGLDGVNIIQATIESESWPENSVVIGGIDGLSKDDYIAICEHQNTNVAPQNGSGNIAESQWINSCITWVKDRNGNVTRWIQLKISKSWDEARGQHTDMYEGRSVYLFNAKFGNDGPDFYFMSLLCFDWIGRKNGNRNSDIILTELNDLATPLGSPRPLHLYFVLQCNPEPDDDLFLGRARDYFTESLNNLPFARRVDTAIAMFNCAGDENPGPVQNFGKSLIVYSPTAPFDRSKCCLPTWASSTAKLLKSNSLSTCRRALFRENGSCIHVFKFIHPLFRVPEPSYDRLPLESAKVFPIELGLDDPRIPGDIVSAITKWSNDRLDEMTPVDNNFEDIKTSHELITREMRMCDSKLLIKKMALSSPKIELSKIDEWLDEEQVYFKTMIHALSMIKIAVDDEEFEIREEVHALFVLDKDVIQVIVVSGENHQENLKHTISNVSTQKVKTIVISEDRNDNPFGNIDKPITEPRDDVDAQGASLDITNPTVDVQRLAYSDFRVHCLGAETIDQLRTRVREKMGV